MKETREERLKREKRNRQNERRIKRRNELKSKQEEKLKLEREKKINRSEKRIQRVRELRNRNAENNARKNQKINPRTNKQESSNIISKILMIVFLIVLLVSALKIVIWFINNKSTSNMMNKINEVATRNIRYDEGQEKHKRQKVNYKELKEMNSDMVGWIKVNGTEVNHPVVQTDNNSYYLNRSFDKSRNAAGWIFADKRNKMDGTDKNIVIYGHNRLDGSMFCTLKNTLKPNWINNMENREILFQTEKGLNVYEVFSIYEVPAEDYYTQIKFKTNDNGKEYMEFLNKIKGRSKYNIDVELKKEDKILTLSTCGDTGKTRIVVHAKLKQ